MPNEFPASRFLDDLPDELLDWRRRESSMAVLRSGAGYGSGYGVGGYAPGSYGNGSGAPRTGPAKRAVPPSPDGPTFGSATPRPAGDVPSLQVGDRVTHDAYGLGTVVVVEGAGPNAVAKIDFGSEGTKRLLLRYSPVSKL
ncbi:hypothetical protein [Cellulomonas sp. ATA003]|uniref:hypothetical protein n=1 Tax=Cellulomonas sp. ATA003 TaxID=3073064 RepID=UPI0037C165F9